MCRPCFILGILSYADLLFPRGRSLAQIESAHMGYYTLYLMLGGYDMKIIVLVDKSGNAQTIVKGVQGSSCMSVTKPLLDKLGIITSDVKTEEYDGFIMTGVEQETVAQQVCRNFQG